MCRKVFLTNSKNITEEMLKETAEKIGNSKEITEGFFKSDLIKQTNRNTISE